MKGALLTLPVSLGTCFTRRVKNESRTILTIFDNNYRHSQTVEIPKRCIYTRKYMSRMFLSLGNPQPTDSDLVCKSHKLFLYNDILSLSHTGAFHLLPFGLRALEKLVRLIDEEMQSLGCEKVALTTLTPKKLWTKTGRWNLLGGELFRIRDRHDIEYCLGPTHEEAVTDLIKSHSPISSKRFPIMIYQITRKFRDEMAPKYGLLRGREFEMKDLYTFDVSEDKAKETYNNICEAYSNIFNRLNLKYIKVAGDSGAIGGDLSHEFHLPASTGQDKILLCADCQLGWNQELVDADGLQKCSRPNCGPNLEEETGIEVGHAFYLGTKYSKTMDATFTSESGDSEFLQMGCYGLGVTRILQAGVEVLSLENQIRWPPLLAPYQIVLIPQKEGYMADVCFDLAEKLSDRLSHHAALTNEVVIDDRVSMTIGKRIYESKRIGFPYIIVLGKTILQTPPLFELIDTSTGETNQLTEDQMIDRFSSIQTICVRS